jgi:hypothetical protein
MKEGFEKKMGKLFFAAPFGKIHFCRWPEPESGISGGDFLILVDGACILEYLSP